MKKGTRKDGCPLMRERREKVSAMMGCKHPIPLIQMGA